jgi:hypothetical protein
MIELGYLSDQKLCTNGKNWFAAACLADGPTELSKFMLVVIPADLTNGNKELKKDFTLGIGNHSFRVTIRLCDSMRGIWRKIGGKMQLSKQATVWPAEVNADILTNAVLAHPELREELATIHNLQQFALPVITEETPSEWEAALSQEETTPVKEVPAWIEC